MDQNIIDKSPVVTRPAGGALVEVENSRAVAEVQASLVLAKRFPRDQIVALDRIKTACQRPGLAEKALYSYARGGSDIGGPSIRLAEAVAQNWGNLDFGIRELEQRPGESTVEAFAWDKETNVRQTKTFQVKHKRYTKKGSYDLEDSRDIYEVTANQGARRLRACILGIIPGDIIDEAVAQCEETLKTEIDTSAAALKKMLEAFEPFKVTREMVERRIQRRLDAITPAQFIQLKKIYNSLKDNMSTASDWFELAETPQAADDNKGTASDKLKNKLKKNTQQTQEAHPQGKSAEQAEKPAEEKPVQPAENGQPQTEEYAPAECPDSPGTTYKKEHCDNCQKREGCPVWA